MFKSPWILFLILIIAGCGPRHDEDWRTDYEKSTGLETPRYDATIRYIRRLEKASPWVRLRMFGTTPQGRPLPLVIVDKSGKFTPSSARHLGKAVVLIQAGIHAGEIDGKDAGLMLIRDMVIHHRHDEWLDNVVLLFMPIFNVDGHERFGPYNRVNQNGPKEMGWRTTAQNLNLNRDYMKADAPEMRDWLRVFHTWRPDLFIDCHVTDGADYRHVVTYSIDLTDQVAEPVRTWSRDVYLPHLYKTMKADGFPLSPYVWPVNDKDISQGIIGGSAPPRFSTGYGAVNNRPALLIETHMFKDYASRVEGTRRVLAHTLELVHSKKESLLEAVRNADHATATMSGSFVGLRWDSSSAYETIDFEGFNFRLEKSDLSNDSMVVWENVPIDYQLPFYNHVRRVDSAVVPYAWLIPKEWTPVIDVLKAHGVVMRPLDKARTLPVHSYIFDNVKWADRSFEGRITVTYQTTPVIGERSFQAGDWLIPMDQPANRLVMNLLEPGSADALVFWGFFNALFEQKEYGEAYKLEELARSMIADQPGLLDTFKTALRNDPLLAANSYERLNWFYKRSPYWDRNMNRYPPGKIMRKEDLP